jgi:hypothetical protein
MSESADSDSLESCANCGERLDEHGRWYPTLARQVEDGVKLFAFCDATCRSLFRE